MKCVCGFEGQAAIELSAAGTMVSQCPTCRVPEQVLPPLEVSAQLLVHPSPSPTAFRVGLANAKGDLVAIMRERLLVLDGEILKRKEFEAEAKKLRKMLKVAERVEAQATRKRPVSDGLTLKN